MNATTTLNTVKVTQLHPGMRVRDQINHMRKVVQVEPLHPNFKVTLEPDWQDVGGGKLEPIERIEIVGPTQKFRTV